MKPNYNLAHVILESAEKHRDHVAIRTVNDFVSYDMLRNLIVNYALHMRHHGVSRASCVAIDSEHPILASALAMACSLLGCSWVRATNAALANQAIGITHQIHDGTKHQQERKGVLRVTQHWSDPPVADAGRAAPIFPGFASPDRAWMIAQSSGTTGEAKCMALTELNMWRRVTGASPVTLPARPVCAVLFPPLSSPGMLLISRTLAEGGTCVFADRLDLLQQHRIDCAYGSPGHYVGLLRDAPSPKVKLPLAIFAGALARPPFMIEMLRYFDRLEYRYGSTEAGTVCAKMISTAADLADGLSVGQAQMPIELQIVAGDGAVLPALHEGIVRLRSPMLVSSYIGDPAISVDVFRDGWFYPGDLGVFSASGDLSIVGRVGDQLNIGGVKLNPELVDEVIQSHPGIGEGACFALPGEIGIDRFAAAIVVTAPMDVVRTVRSLEKRIWDKFGPSRTPGEFYVVESIPKNQNGKTMRRLLVDTVQGLTAIDLDS